LTAAFAKGRGVTAKVRWVVGSVKSTGAVDEAGSATTGAGTGAATANVTPAQLGRDKWIHCTPLTGSHGEIGVWMVVIVDDERDRDEQRWRASTTGRMAPHVASSMTSGEWEPSVAGFGTARRGSDEHVNETVNDYGYPLDSGVDCSNPNLSPGERVGARRV